MRRTRWTTATAATGLSVLALFGTAACADTSSDEEQGTEQEESGDSESGEGESDEGDGDSESE
jgi:hypothetical protein